METKSGEEQKRGEEERYYYLYSPCYFFELVKAVLKCLGSHHDYESTTQLQADGSSYPSGTERAMKTTEEEFALESSSRAIRVPRPPIDPGRGGQINSATTSSSS